MNGLDVLERCRDGASVLAQLEIGLSMREDALARVENDELLRERNALAWEIDRQRQRMSVEMRAAVWICETLPMNLRKVAAARYIRRESVAEIASSQYISESTVKRYLKEADAQLAALDGEALNGCFPEWYEAEQAPAESDDDEL